MIDDAWWIVRFGTPGLNDQQSSFDRGATWQRFRTAWRGPFIADSTFWHVETSESDDAHVQSPIPAADP